MCARPSPEAASARPQDAQVALERLVPGQRGRALDQLDQRRRIDQPRGRPACIARAARARSLAKGLRAARRRGAEDRNVLAGLVDREREAGVQKIEDVAAGGAGLEPGAQAAGLVLAVLQLNRLEPQALCQADRPRDVRAAVEIVADPAGDGHQVGVQLGPALGIDPARDVEHEAGHPRQRGMQIADRVQGLAMLLIEIERLIGPMCPLLRPGRGAARGPRRRAAGRPPRRRAPARPALPAVLWRARRSDAP